MKKMIGILAGMALVVGSAFGGMDDRDYSLSVISTATNSASYVLRGKLNGIYVNAPAGATGVVTVASAGETIFSKTISADAMYHPSIVFDTDNGTDTSTYTHTPLYGPVTATVVGLSAGTNAWVVTVVYEK